jgi:hypothetical protein
MVETRAYLDTGDNAYVILGNKGMALSIYLGEKTVGTLVVVKSGIRWLPKKYRWKRKGKSVLGKRIATWKKLDEMAANVSG